MSSRYQFSLRCLLSLVTCVSILIASCTYVVRQARDAGSRAVCNGHLMMIAIALRNYQSQWGVYPPAYISGENGKPLHSWRVLLLPHLGHWSLYNRYRFDEPWDSEHNSQLIASRPDVFGCPLDREGANRAYTNYVLVTGPGTAYPSPSEFPIATEVASRWSALQVVEVAGYSVLWTEPADLRVDQMDYTVGISSTSTGRNISSNHQGGAEVLWGNGVPTFLPSSVTPAELRALTSGSERDRDEVYVRYRGPYLDLR